MAQQKGIAQVDKIQGVSVIDLLLFDHQFIKDCIEVFLDDNALKKKKLSLVKPFLEAIQKHSVAEKKAVYQPLESNEELHFTILEAEIEHGIIDQKVKFLKNKFARSRVLRDEDEVELKVLADILKNHLMEEESEMLPKMRESVDEATLTELGADFMKLRKLKYQDLSGFPLLEEELIEWKDSVQRVSSRFLTKMDKYMESMKH